jgi:enolase-phosphatase E1
LQGLIWREGYASGELHGAVFDDVRPALERWAAAGVRHAIYSSGSVLAQQLLFSTTPFGDLTPLIDRHFDTAVGPKRSPESYRMIANQCAVPADRILFISDVAEELDAAKAAGLHTALATRPGNAPAAASDDIPRVGSFDEVVIA